MKHFIGLLTDHHINQNSTLGMNLIRSSRLELSYEKGVFRNLKKFSGKNVQWSPILNRKGLQQNRTPLQVFSCKICKFFRTAIL